MPESAADVQEPDVVVNPVKVAGKGIPDVPPTQNAGAEPEKGTADCAEPEESAVEGAVSETSAEDLEARETTPPVPAPAPQAPSSPPESAPNGDVHEDQRSHSPASVEIEGVALGAEDAGTEEATTDVDQADKAAEHPTDSFENHVRLDNAERIGSSAGPDEEAEDGTVTTANSEVPDNSQNQEDAGETPSEAENKEPDAQGSDDTRDNNGCKPTPEQGRVTCRKAFTEKSIFTISNNSVLSISELLVFFTAFAFACLNHECLQMRFLHTR